MIRRKGDVGIRLLERIVGNAAVPEGDGDLRAAAFDLDADRSAVASVGVAGDIDKDLLHGEIDLLSCVCRTAELVQNAVHQSFDLAQLIENGFGRQAPADDFAVHFETEHCDIVKLRRVPDKGVHAVFDALDDLPGRFAPVQIERVEHAVEPEPLSRGVLGVGDTVGEQEQLIAAVQLEFEILVPNISKISITSSRALMILKPLSLPIAFSPAK